MSATILYILNGKSVTYFDEFENGWGTAPAAHEFLIEKYHGPNLPLEFRRDCAIRDFIQDRKIEGDELMVLMFLMKDAYIPKERLRAAAAECETFGARIPDDGYVNHWPAIGKALREMAEMMLSRHAVGACITSSDVMDHWRECKGLSEQGWSIFKPMNECP